MIKPALAVVVKLMPICCDALAVNRKKPQTAPPSMSIFDCPAVFLTRSPILISTCSRTAITGSRAKKAIHVLAVRKVKGPTKPAPMLCAANAQPQIGYNLYSDWFYEGIEKIEKLLSKYGAAEVGQDVLRDLITDPKTKNSFRSIPIPVALVKMLNEYRRSQPLDIHRRLFPRPYGTYYGMKAAIKTVDSRLSPHCLRHTYATHLLGRGMDIRTVAALLGDNVKTVINTYIHYSDDMRAAAADDIEKIFAENF